MRFTINGREYEGVDIFRLPASLVLALPAQAGIGVSQLSARLSELGRLARDETGCVIVLDEVSALTPEGSALLDRSAFLDSEPHLRALLAYVWASRVAGGERVSFEQSCEFELNELIESLVDEDEEAVGDVEPDPTQPGSVPDAAPAPSE